MALVIAATAITALGIVASGLRGSDYPGQLYRVGLFRDAGLTIWNSDWYSGHYTLGYSVLFPPLGAWLGISVVGVASTVAAVMAFRVLIVELAWRGANTAAAWFAMGMIVNLAVGRLTFGLGVAFGLTALVSLQRRRTPLAIGLALATSLSSPVAGMFLAIATTALAADCAAGTHRPWRSASVRIPVLTAIAAAAPIGVTAVLFRSPGVFPFRAGHLLGIALTGVGLIILFAKRHRAVGIAAALMVGLAVPLFLIPNPLGGNLVRLPTIFAGPIVAGPLLPSRRRLVAVAAVPLGIWMLLPLTSATDNIGAESASADFYRPVVDFVERAGGPLGRIEIPFTAGHWEVAYIAPDLPIARGWERQTDMAKNPLFYDDTLDASSYRHWLDENAVRWVAVPDIAIDHGGAAEIALIDGADLPWLTKAWTNGFWTIYEVTDAIPIVTSPGHLVAHDGSGLVIRVDAAGDVLVRESYTPYWQLSGIDGCVSESPDGFTVIEAAETGVATIEPRFSFDAAFTESDDAC